MIIIIFVSCDELHREKNVGMFVNYSCCSLQFCREN